MPRRTHSRSPLVRTLLVGLATVTTAGGLRALAQDASPAAIETDFRKVMTARSMYDDEFSHAMIRVSNEHRSLISRNYLVAGSAEKIDWLRDHPDRLGARLFQLDSGRPEPTRIADSTHFGFIPNRPLAYLVSCSGMVHFWDTQTHRRRDVQVPHSLAEGSGPNPAVSPDGALLVTQTADALHFWDVQNFTRLGPAVEQDRWSFKLQFSSDGRWLFTQSGSLLRVWDPTSRSVIAGPFRHDLIEDGIPHSATAQRLATFENDDEARPVWSSALVLRSGPEWVPQQRIELTGHTRDAQWLDDQHLLVISDEKPPGREPPYSYGRKRVSIVSLSGQRAQVTPVVKHPWIFHASVAPDGQHFFVTTRQSTSCWRVGQNEPVWTSSGRHTVSYGNPKWVLLHEDEIAAVHAVADGRVLWRREGVTAAQLQGSSIWVCTPAGVEVWEKGSRSGRP